MRDVQSEDDDRRIALKKVGIKNLRYPITVRDKTKTEQHTVASVNLSVDLPHRFRGAHMSRFVEALNSCRGMIGVENMQQVLHTVRSQLKAKEAHLEMQFPYFIEKRAPVSGAKGLMEYVCRFIVSSNNGYDFVLAVEVPVTNLCPCSKELAERGAHNQRGLVTVQVRFETLVWIEELVDVVEASASCDLYAVLKRRDEKFVTERAYSRPRFVEDIVREIALRLDADGRITWYTVEAENQESIHNHSAYAAVERDKTRHMQQAGTGGDFARDHVHSKDTSRART